MEKDAEKVFIGLKQNISTYCGLQLELLKLNTYERVAKVTAILSHGIILILLAFFATLFLFLALGFFLGERLNSISLGFVIVAALYLLLFFILIASKEKIHLKVSNIIIEAILEKDDHNDEKQTTIPSGETDI